MTKTEEQQVSSCTSGDYRAFLERNPHMSKKKVRLHRDAHGDIHGTELDDQGKGERERFLARGATARVEEEKLTEEQRAKLLAGEEVVVEDYS